MESGGEKIAEMEYSFSQPGTMIILHTEADENMKGKNIGKQLLDQALDHARAKKFSIIAICLFVKSVIAKNPEAFKDELKT